MKLAQEIITGFGKKIDESIPTSIEIGKTYTSKSGNKITITKIRVLGFHLREPYADIDYKFKTTEGKTGTESNSVQALKRLLEE